MMRKPSDKYASRCQLSKRSPNLIQIREGFIVDEDEEDDEERRQRRRERKKRRREEREAEDAQLDEEDLDLIGETHPDYQRRQEEQVT